MERVARSGLVSLICFVALLFAGQRAEATDINGTIVADGSAILVPITSSGQKAYYTFSGATGQRLGVGITQVSGLSGYVYVVKPDGTNLAGGTYFSSSGSQIDPVALPVSGTYTLKVDPGVTTGNLTLTLSNDIVGTIAIDGSTVSTNISRPGQNSRHTFTGATGQQLGVGITQVSGLSGYVSIIKPDGTNLTSGTYFSSSGSQIEPVALPVSGTYTLKVDPGLTTGSLTLTLSNDIVGTISINGSAVSTSIGRAGQNSRYTFSGTAGQLLGVGITQVSGLSGYVSIVKPDGTNLTSGTYFSASGSQIDPVALPVSGTYTLRVDPGLTTGSMVLTLSSDIVGTIAIGGATVSTSISRPGQNSRYAFTGATGQQLGVGITQVSGLSGYVYVVKPDGTNLTGGTYFSGSGSQIDPIALPVSGTYTLKVDPGLTTGSLALTLSSDIVGTIAIDGSTVSTSTSRPGQNSRYTFTGAMGQQLGVGITQVSGLSGYVSIIKPDGTNLTSGTYFSSYDNDIDPVALPTPGTYTIKIDPGLTTGGLTLTLSSDIVGTISIDGSPVTANISRVGQNARYTFTGAASQLVGVLISPGGLSGYVHLLNPDGTTLASASIYSSSSNDFGLVTLPSAGTYTLLVDPGATTGSVTLKVNNAVPPPPFWEALAGQYSYDGNTCSTQKDPITTIFRQSGASIATHVSHHGSTNGDDPTDPALRVDAGDHQYFIEMAQCTEGMVSQANKGTNSGFPWFNVNSRWHVRCDINAAIGDPVGGTLAACTPHYDQPADSCTHKVPAVFGNLWPGMDPAKSGFDAGRDYLYYLLVTVGQHRFITSQNWGNDDKMLQCDNELSGSDGYVNEIGN